jgi:MOSC domain-containing protein YiiM
VPVPRLLMKNYDHADCGVYAEVIEGGEIASGDRIETP